MYYKYWLYTSQYSQYIELSPLIPSQRIGATTHHEPAAKHEAPQRSAGVCTALYLDARSYPFVFQSIYYESQDAVWNVLDA